MKTQAVVEIVRQIQRGDGVCEYFNHVKNLAFMMMFWKSGRSLAIPFMIVYQVSSLEY